MSGISPNQWTILESLKDGPRWSRSFGTVKPLLNDLIERGFIERCKPPCGWANNMVRLSPKGCAELEIDIAEVPDAAEPQASAPQGHKWTFGPIRADAKPKTRETCERFRAAIEAGEGSDSIVTRLAASYGVNRPAIWTRLRSGGLLPPYNPRPRAGASVIKAVEPRVQRPVDRDPCPRCGVRADVGCRHPPARFGLSV